MMNGAASVIHASQQRNAARGGRHIGDLISWNGEGVDVLRERAREAFAVVNMGLETLVPAPAPPAALTRAVGEARRPAGIRVQALVQPNADTPVAYGVYQVGTGGEAGDKWNMGARVRGWLGTWGKRWARALHAVDFGVGCRSPPGGSAVPTGDLTQLSLYRGHAR